MDPKLSADGPIRILCVHLLLSSELRHHLHDSFSEIVLLGLVMWIRSLVRIVGYVYLNNMYVDI